MENVVNLTCRNCGAANSVHVAENAADDHTVHCEQCGAAISTVGKLHAQVAQEAAGIGASELEDDHVPLGGPPFGETT